jgi:hypothetical protein
MGRNTEINLDAGRDSGRVQLLCVRGYFSVRTQTGTSTQKQGASGTNLGNPDIRVSMGIPEARSAPCFVSDSNGSRSVTTSATLDRWQRVPAETDSGLFAINARKSPLPWLAVRHHGEAFKGGVFHAR